MKNITKIIILLLVTGLTVSCETDYNDYETNRDPVVGLVGGTGGPNINVPVGGSAEKEVRAFSSVASSQGITFSVSIASSSEVGAASVSFPATITIPANEREVMFVVTVNDVNLTTEIQDLDLVVTSTDEIVSGTPISFNVKQQ
ncbi:MULTISPECIES: hypothetical protein [Altibacter]|uniref:hypothetical protein n=1 Tax=Altibacter TaxID=1535231 RepID=UPI0005501EBE|nr:MULTISPECIES: hypothetical protein [Altibacter]MCW8981830.1 hypothetical protein [Altibacter sp.]MCW9036660.1 hypothetical protein [Altibacter sp.]